MRSNASIILLTVFVSVATALVQAQRGHGMGMPNYDPKSETTVNGAVQQVQQHQMMGHQGTHLIVKTESGELEVHLGPASYLAQRQFSFTKGDQVEVTGSMVKMGGKDALLGRQVTKNGKTLVLRNAQGIPAWSGGPRPQ